MNYTDKVTNIIDGLTLPKGMECNKEIIKSRFVEEVSYYEKKRDKTKKYYNVFRFIVTTGSILLPAILSIGQMDPAKLPKNFDQVTYWSSWTISLLVTISNGFLQLFSLDKNYFNYSIVVEQLKTEGWQYFGLSGKYEDHETHDKESYKKFCKAVENIKRKQVENEFQGKGNDTKKKDKKSDDKKSPLLDFDFEGQMRAFMEKSQNSKISQPLGQTSETVSNSDNIKKTVNNNISKANNEVTETITENVNNVTENIPGEIIPNRDIESN